MVVLALLVTLVAFVAANGFAVRALQQEIAIVEKQQQKRWESYSRTNSTAVLP